MRQKEAKLGREIERIVKLYEQEPDPLVLVLQKVQERLGYIPPEAIEIVAEKLKVFPSKVYGVTTFYSQFRMKPSGQNIIRICHGTACHVRGAEKISTAVCDHLSIAEGGTTQDGKFTVERVFCVGSCSLAPIMRVNEHIYGRLTPRAAQSAVRRYEK